MKIVCLFAITALVLLGKAQEIERGFLNVDDIKLVILKEMDSMHKHNDFFDAYNIFFTTCEHKIVPMLDHMGYEEDDNVLYCKLIENAIPEYFMPVFTVNTALNDNLIEKIIKDFFKIYTELAFNLENIRIAKIFHDNISMLYKLRNIFPFEEGYFVALMKDGFIPEDSFEIEEKPLQKASNNFVNLIIYKFIDKSASLLYSNPRLYIYTLQQLFNEPFEIITYFLNDIIVAKNSFMIKYGERRLYLLDNLDNMALKSLNIFKTKRTNQIIDSVAKQQKIDNKEGKKEKQVQNIESLEEYLSTDQYTPHEEEKSEINFRLINICVKSSAFASQSLEKIFCYYLTEGIKNVNYLIEHDKYNFKLQEIFRKISKENESKFIKYKPSYFTEESEYNNNIYPKFRASLSTSAKVFRKEIKKLEKQFYDDHVNSIRKNFFYHWRKIIAYFLSQTVYRPGISPETLNKNMINFFQFVQDNWIERRETEFFKLNELYQHFLTTYHENLLKFTKFK